MSEIGALRAGTESGLPVVVIGAGPVGLAAAAELILRGEHPLVLEAGDRVGAAVLEWGHVRLFSPWRYCLAPAARTLLERSGWTAPDLDAHPTGRELVEGYLAPLAAHPEVARAIRLGARVTAVTREGRDRMSSSGRDEQPFDLRVVTGGRLERLRARSVLDASGTWATPNPLGAAGLPALGEEEVRAHVRRGIPDPGGAERARYAGRRVLVVGRGHSAFNALIELLRLREEEPGTEVVWATRRRLTGAAFGGGTEDGLPERARLGSRVGAAVAAGGVELWEGFGVESLALEGGRVRVRDGEGRSLLVDEIVCATGFRPDLSLTSELRLRLDAIVEAPEALAPLIDPNLHSCGSVPPHGEAELAHPERGFYTAGMKSYGRAPTFLMLTGHEQVRSIAAALTGDLEGARRVELVLPPTGVCSTGPGLAALAGRVLPVLPAATSCCAPEALPAGLSKTFEKPLNLE